MIYLGNIKSDDAPDNFTTVVRILEFFTQKYREDPAFAQRVDASVARILRAKLGVYENFTLSNVVLPAPDLTTVGGATDITFTVARNSATLVSPSLSGPELHPAASAPAERAAGVHHGLRQRSPMLGMFAPAHAGGGCV